jgi:trimethylamine monooxygenase
MEETDYPSFDIDGINKIFLEWEHNKEEDIMEYRNKAFKSVMTGNMQKVHHTKWINAFDDSLEDFLK